MTRRQYGTGSVFQRKTDGKWMGQFDAGYLPNGNRRRVTVTAPTQATAKRRLKEKMDEHARGVIGISRSPTVKAWADEWLTITERTVRPKSFGTDKGAVRKWIVPTLGHRRLDQLTPADLRNLVKAITAEHSTTTARRYVATLKVMLRAAVQEGHKVNASVLAFKPPAKAVHDRQALTLPHAVAVLAQASHAPDGTRWVAALLLGMRQGECLGLTWDAVDLDRRVLVVSWQLQSLPYVDRRDKRRGFRIPDGYEARRLERSWHLVRPKSRAGWRTIPLAPPLVTALARWRTAAPVSPHGLVWPALDGSPRKPTDDRAQWQALQRAAGVQHPSGRLYTVHEARHASATRLLELEVPESVRVAIMGHSSIAVTHGYEHVTESLARDALDRAADLMGLG